MQTNLYPTNRSTFYTKVVAGVLKFFRRSDNTEFYAIDGANLSAYGKQVVNLAAATQTLTAAQHGQRFVGAVDAVFTLPAVSSANKGVRFSFETGSLSSGTGLSVSPAAADHIRGNGLTSVDNKDLINTGATDRLGDSVEIYSDGADGWVIDKIIGTWAKEA